MRKQHRVRAGLLWAIFCSIIVLIACSEEPGRILVTHDQLVGAYESNFFSDSGIERLELRANGTYTQDFHSTRRSFQNSGKWKAENEFLGGTNVVLLEADISENPLTSSGNTETMQKIKKGDCILNAHKRNGKLALARNESFDWYYEKVR